MPAARQGHKKRAVSSSVSDGGVNRGRKHGHHAGRQRGKNARSRRGAEYIGTHPAKLRERFRIAISSERSHSVRSSSDGTESRGQTPSFAVEEGRAATDDSSNQSIDYASSREDVSEAASASASASASPSLAASLPKVFHSPSDEEVYETEMLVLPGETVGDDEDSSLPVRLLSDFTVYLVSSQQLVCFDTSIGVDKGLHYAASGSVQPWNDNEDSDSSEGSTEGESGLPEFGLSRILEVSVHWVEESRKLHLDQNIYLRTEVAWYILGQPSSEYSAFFAPFWVKHFIFHTLLVSAAVDRALSYKAFLRVLQDSEEPLHMIGKDISPQDVLTQSVHAYVLSHFEDLCRSDGQLLRPLRGVPAVAKLLAASKFTSQPKPKFQGKSKATEVTDKIYSICHTLFPLNHFAVCGFRQQKSMLPKKADDYPVHKHNPCSIEFAGKALAGGTTFASVRVDGALYKAGDTVMVPSGEDENKKRAAADGSSLGMWFAKICYFFADDVTGDEMMHVQWYQTGSGTLLQELAHPRALYLLDECDDIMVKTIYQKCHVYELDPSEDEPSEESDSSSYFTGLVWDQDNSTFVQRTASDTAAALEHCAPGHSCLSCGLKNMTKIHKTWTVLDGNSLKQAGVVYHIGDMVYIHPLLDDTDVYVLGQILDIHEPLSEDKEPLVDLQVYQRFDLIARKENKRNFGNQVYDERRLFKTSHVLEEVDVWRIEGKAFAIHLQAVTSQELEHWLSYDDHFYVDQFSDSLRPSSVQDLTSLSARGFKPCHSCYKARKQLLQNNQKLLLSHSPLNGLELFAGAGGLSTGFDLSGYIQTKWAVEMDANAALSYTINHQNTTVYNVDVNQALKHAVATFEGRHPKPLFTSEGIEVPLMPKPGEVDFIYGGPPCQGFSGMNHSKKVDDPRNTLACNMLSFVDFYRPSYFLLENVDALLYAKLKAEQDGAKQVGGINNGMVKFILRTLTALGYQAHLKVLQAGQYGSPQSRLRVIVWGARRTLELPPFPIPTHCTPDDVDKYKLPTGVKLWPAVRVIPDSESREDWLQFAPLLPVTVEDAISDLPKFDWINPHLVLSATEADHQESARRSASGIKRFSAIKDKASNRIHAGLIDGDAYNRPLSRYQKWMRASMGPNDLVSYHYTAKFSAKIVERTVNVPFNQDANHSDLPVELKLGLKYLQANGKSTAAYRTLFGRIDPKGPFSTALTTVSPNAKGGKILHPTQKRILTVREVARSQGFPDHQKFLSRDAATSDAQYRQIGNAVPVPLAYALGKTLGGLLLQQWRNEDNERQEADMDLD